MIDKIEIDPLLKPFVNGFASSIAGILGWKLFKLSEFEQFIKLKRGNDRIALASEALKKQKKNATFSFTKAITPLHPNEGNHHQLFSIQSQQLLGHCWEVLKNKRIVPNNSDPVLEFYRHVRNGCFHGNKFTFYGKEPKYEAEWRSLVITNKLKGQKIFRDKIKDKSYFLNWGDPLVLLSDISKKIKK